MSYNVISTHRFETELKRLAKKYRSLKDEYSRLIFELVTNPSIGIQIGNNCFKIRLLVSSKGKGKRGGARIITYLYSEQKQFIFSQFTIKVKKLTSNQMNLKK
jgi:mRNA-degrading endonuclease RelE of RelBE toxin-antitoxin system